MYALRRARVPLNRLVLAGAVAGAIAPAAAIARPSTASCPPGSNNPDYCQRIPTKLVASPVIPGGVSAVLTRVDTGAPLAGQLLTFAAGNRVLCVATTNAAGRATCTSLLAVLLALVNLGYNVNYAGDAVYLPSSAHGSAVQLDALVLGSTKTRHRAHGAVAMRTLRAELRSMPRSRIERELRVLRARHARPLAFASSQHLVHIR